MSDPSPLPLPGSPAGFTQLEDSVLPVPVDGPIGSLKDPFERYAEGVLAEIQKLLRRLRSQQLYYDAFEPNPDWAVTKQKFRIIGEVWGYLELQVRLVGDAIPIPADGNFPPLVLGILTLPEHRPISLARLVSSTVGPIASGHVLNNGNVTLDAIVNGKAQFAVDDELSLSGMFPLDLLYDSEA